MFGRRPTASSRWLPSTVATLARHLHRHLHALRRCAAPSAHACRARTRRPRARGSPAPRRETSASSRAMIAVGIFEHCHLRAEAAVHLRELEADVAAADDDQVLWQHVQIHHRRVGEIRHVGEARPVGYRRTSADVDEDARRRQHLLAGRSAHAHRVGRNETRMAPQHAEVRVCRSATSPSCPTNARRRRLCAPSPLSCPPRQGR